MGTRRTSVIPSRPVAAAHVCAIFNHSTLWRGATIRSSFTDNVLDGLSENPRRVRSRFCVYATRLITSTALRGGSWCTGQLLPMEYDRNLEAGKHGYRNVACKRSSCAPATAGEHEDPCFLQLGTGLACTEVMAKKGLTYVC